MKPLFWLGASKEVISSFPDDVRQEVGYTIYLAQNGDKGLNAVPMVGFGSAKVLEVVLNDMGNTFRAVYTVKFKGAVYVLHAFQKKAKSGISTPKPDLDLIRQRLKQAEADYNKRNERVNEKGRKNDRSA